MAGGSRPSPRCRPACPSVDELFEFMRDAESRFGDPAPAHRRADRECARRRRHPDGRDAPAPGHGPGHDEQAGRGRRRRVRDLGVGRRARPDLCVRPSARDPASRAQSAARARRSATSRARPQVYEPITALPMETLPDTFVHPAGYCQNVLATGRCAVVESRTLLGRETVGLVCAHPRTIELTADRPDFRIDLAVDRATRRHPAPDRVGRRRRSPAWPRSTELAPDASAAAERLRLRLPDRDDDALLTPGQPLSRAGDRRV